MKLADLLVKMGIKEEHIEGRILGNTDLDFVDGDYTVRCQDIRTNNMIQSVHIFPHFDWTDGTHRPVYCDGHYNVCLFLNTKYVA